MKTRNIARFVLAPSPLYTHIGCRERRVHLEVRCNYVLRPQYRLDGEREQARGAQIQHRGDAVEQGLLRVRKGGGVKVASRSLSRVH